MSRSTRRQTIAVLVFVVVALFFAVSFRTAVVKGDSMLPAFHDGQVVLVSRLHGVTGPLRRNDVVLLRRGHEVLIKRILYTSGEILSFRDMPSFYRVSEYFDIAPAAPGTGFPRLRVPRGFVVVLGDNRAVSDDSRTFGPVPIRDILGRVVNAPPGP